MKHEKPLSDQPMMASELRALRGEEPTEQAIDRAVRTMQAPPAPSRAPRPRLLWNATAVAASVGAVALALTMTSSSATAAEFRRISDAVKAQQNRHDRAFRPDEHGNMVMTNETWIEGAKQREVMIDKVGRKSNLIYDGRRQYISYPNEVPFVDDCEPSKIPIEDLAAYLNIEGGRVRSHVKRGSFDMYTIDFSGMSFDLTIDPISKLPVSRDVKDKAGNVFEHNEYDYPADIADGIFTIPSGNEVCDYPKLRDSFAAKLSEPGESKTVGGVTITLKAVLVGRGKVLAVWTGGARGDSGPGTDMFIENYPKPIATGRPEQFSVPSPRAANAPGPTGSTLEQPTIKDASGPNEGIWPTLKMGGQELRGDGAWISGPAITGPIKINVPVWAEDRTRPLILSDGKAHGFHSKMVGRVTFEVKDPIFASSPDRVLFRPDGGAAQTGTASEGP